MQFGQTHTHASETEWQGVEGMVGEWTRGMEAQWKLIVTKPNRTKPSQTEPKAKQGIRSVSSIGKTTTVASESAQKPERMKKLRKNPDHEIPCCSVYENLLHTQKAQACFDFKDIEYI